MGKKDRQVSAAIRATLVIMQEDAFDPRLGSHKLKGDLAGLWACSAGYDLRIVFKIWLSAEVADQTDSSFEKSAFSC